MRVFVLTTDAYGGRGGIARYNRDMIRAFRSVSERAEVVAIPRVMPDPPDAIPGRVTFRTDALDDKVAYVRAALATAATQPRFDAVVCSHIHLLPVAYAVARAGGLPLVLVVYGIDAWQPTRRRLVDPLVRAVDAFVSLSEFTAERLLSWSGAARARGFVIPPCVDLSRFTPGPKPAYLLNRYALRGRTVITTVSRLSTLERYKGHEQVMGALPELARTHPELTYLIVGDGDDRARLEARAQALGVRDRVVFAGHVRDEEKADHFRLSDAFVMPGRGEGFGIVYLEALACGVPVVASTADASREAVLDGALGQLADPDDPTSVVRAIRTAVGQERREVSPRLEHFSNDRFDERWRAVLDAVVPAAATAGRVRARGPVLTRGRSGLAVPALDWPAGAAGPLASVCARHGATACACEVAV